MTTLPVYDGSLAGLPEAQMMATVLASQPVSEALVHPCDVGQVVIGIPAKAPTILVTIEWRRGRVSISAEMDEAV